MKKGAGGKISTKFVTLVKVFSNFKVLTDLSKPTTFTLKATKSVAKPTKFNCPCGAVFSFIGTVIVSLPLRLANTPPSLTSKTCLKKFSSKATFRPSKVNSTLPSRVPPAVSTVVTALAKSFISPTVDWNPFLPVSTAVELAVKTFSSLATTVKEPANILFTKVEPSGREIKYSVLRSWLYPKSSFLKSKTPSTAIVPSDLLLGSAEKVKKGAGGTDKGDIISV